jgi:ubiquinone/menaquinone biosynthesis C-methylase UbiE
MKDVTEVRKMSHTDFDHMVSFFDRMVQTDWLSNIHQNIVDQASRKPSGKAIDIGCGTGRLLQRLMVKYATGIGVDLSPEMVKEATRQAEETDLNKRLHFVQGDAYHLPFNDEEFDASFSTCVMFLLPEPEIGIKEMVRVTKKSGELFMLNPSPKMSVETASSYIAQHCMNGFEAEALLKWSNVSTSRHRYSKDELRATFISHGLGSLEFIDVLDGLAHITYAVKE